MVHRTKSRASSHHHTAIAIATHPARHRPRPGQQARGKGAPPPPPQQRTGGGGAGGAAGARPPPKKPRARRNQEITAPEVRAVLPDGTNRVVPLSEALRLARDLGLDLVEVPGTRDPAVAKIVDWEELAAAQRKVRLSVSGEGRLPRLIRSPSPPTSLYTCDFQPRRQAEEEAARKERLREKMATPKEIQFTARIGGGRRLPGEVEVEGQRAGGGEEGGEGKSKRKVEGTIQGDANL